MFVGVGPTDARPTVGACWLDIDNDGDLDLYLANQSGATDAMWRNDGDSFTDVAPALGMTGPQRTKDEGGVGCAIGDYDNDGDLDIFAPNYGHNLLYRNNNNGTFTEVGQGGRRGRREPRRRRRLGRLRQRRRPRSVGDLLRGRARRTDAAERALPQRRRGGLRQRAVEGQPAQRRRPWRAVCRL